MIRYKIVFAYTAITITGNGAANTVIQANASSNTATYRVFEVSGAGNLTLGSLTVRHGRCRGSCATNGHSGGGIYNAGTLTVSNVTFSGNSAYSLGGGMFNNSSSPTLTNVTFSANSADGGGGMYNNSGSPTLTNTLIANSASGGDCFNFSSALNAASSNNLIEDTGSNACGLTNGVDGNIIGQDPNLGALADNGGTTETIALGIGSPAINAGNDANCPSTDQRGIARPYGSHCDIGAYESEFSSVEVITGKLSWCKQWSREDYQH